MNDDPYPGAINFNNLNKQIKRMSAFLICRLCALLFLIGEYTCNIFIPTNRKNI